MKYSPLEENISYQLQNGLFLPILLEYNGETISDEVIEHYLDNSEQIGRLDLALLASVCFIYDKSHLLLKHDTESSDRYVLFVNSFDFSILPILFRHNKKCIPKTLIFFKENFSPNNLIFNSPNTGGFFQETILHINKTDYEELFSYVFEFISILHPNSHNIEDTLEPEIYYDYYFKILVQCYGFYFDLADIKPLISLSIIDDTHYYDAYFHRLHFFFKSRINEETRNFSALFKVVFENPFLCAYAFKTNHSRFLAYCDIPNAIKKCPECFS